MWWQSLSNFQQVAFIIASSATIILLIFLIMLMFGLGDESFDGGDTDVDFDGFNDEPISAFGGLRILSLRGGLTFFSIGGWTSYILEPVIGIGWGLTLGILAGATASILLALAFRLSLRLESSGNIDYQHGIGKTATIYLRVPKNKSGKGKITLILQERLVEVDAVTNESEDLLTNQIVEIIGLEDEQTFIVKKKD